MRLQSVEEMSKKKVKKLDMYNKSLLIFYIRLLFLILRI